jgi:uncharacterized membrane protein
MVGAFPAVKDEVKGAKKTPLRIALFCLGMLIPVALGIVSALGSTQGEIVKDVFASVSVWHIIGGFFVGTVMSTTQIVPGLSASAFLMAIGWFTSLMNSVSMTYWSQNPAVWGIYVGLAVGFLLGMFTFSKLLTCVFSKARHTAYSLIVGLSLGSVLSMFCNGDIVAVYVSWAKNGVSWLDVGLGAGLFIVGVIGAYLLVRYQRKKDAENAEKGESEK